MGSTCESQWGTHTRVSAGRGSRYACMLDWDPSNCDSRKTLHGPGWKNRCSDGKISVNRETGHSYCVSSHTFSSSTLKSDRKSLYGMQRKKQEINVYWILNCLSDVCCVANEFPWFSFPLLSFLISYAYGWKFSQRKRSRERYRILTKCHLTFLADPCWPHACMHTYVYFPCHSPGIPKAEHNVDCICCVDIWATCRRTEIPSLP